MSAPLLGICNDSKINEALELFQKVVENGYPCDQWTCNIIISGRCRSGQTRFALDILRGMNRNGSFNADVIFYARKERCKCKQKRVKEACRMLKLMSERGLKPAISCSSLIHGFCLSSQWKEATSLFNRMMDEGIYLDIVTFNSLIDAFCKQKRMKETCRMLELMSERGVKPNVFTYSSFIHEFCLSGQWKANKLVP
ncbi:Pentatricopeptide repeat (PPR) superfamily protein [Theobroma cacao]|uniref:Pentatricopeptide repeat (PPR) superfamily protein n=1 Tax=Theobroma cacao TaxID=3641 RepID=A0A061EK46_THECC|nr:Pentatricopeptide repeat (PPR) superfamily protein [Theobroma cacao]